MVEILLIPVVEDDSCDQIIEMTINQSWKEIGSVFLAKQKA